MHQAQAELILKINNEIAANLELVPLLRSVTQTLRSALGCDFVVISVPDHELGLMRVLALDFPESRGVFREGAQLSLEHSVVGKVYRTRRRLLVTDLSDLDPVLHARTLAEGISEGCFCPLIHRDRGLGVMTAGWRDAGRYTDDVGAILDAVAIQVAIALDNAMAYQKISELKDQLAREKLYLEDEIRGELNFSEIVGSSSALRRVLKQVETVAPTDSNVLIYGETGSGKELIARAIHDLSARRTGTFVKLNCAAIPTGLLESELFGHEKGAFTGAVAQRIGRFELANRGTIFLDEIGEIPLELQPKLLRVLQEREFERLGSSRTLRSDARFIAATNRDLSDMVEKHEFRADLYYRLNVFPIQVPPLRDRPEDIPVLVRHFVQQFARRMNRKIESIPAENMNALQRYSWPGNIRELQNLIERAVILSSGPLLQVPMEELKARIAPPRQRNASQTLADAERAHILAVLKETDWVLAGANGAAAKLGMNRSTLRFRMGKLGIERP
jgi:formate hydrogenlyase transcriptional activator